MSLTVTGALVGPLWIHCGWPSFVRFPGSRSIPPRRRLRHGVYTGHSMGLPLGLRTAIYCRYYCRSVWVVRWGCGGSKYYTRNYVWESKYSHLAAYPQDSKINLPKPPFFCPKKLKHTQTKPPLTLYTSNTNTLTFPPCHPIVISHLPLPPTLPSRSSVLPSRSPRGHGSCARSLEAPTPAAAAGRSPWHGPPRLLVGGGGLEARARGGGGDVVRRMEQGVEQGVEGDEERKPVKGGHCEWKKVEGTKGGLSKV